MVTVSWADPETPDGLIHHVFSHFGKIKTNHNNPLGIINGTYNTADDDGDWVKKLNNIGNGERKFWMIVKEPLPSYAILDGKRVTVRHQGQRWTCARCHSDRGSCPGEADARKCEDNGGEKVDLRLAWQARLEKVGYTQWDGGEIDVDQEEEEQWFDTLEGVDDFNSILVRGFADNMDNSAIVDILVEQGCNVTDMENMVVSTTENANCRMISGVTKEVLQDIWKKIDNKPIQIALEEIKQGYV